MRIFRTKDGTFVPVRNNENTITTTSTTTTPTATATTTKSTSTSTTSTTSSRNPIEKDINSKEYEIFDPDRKDVKTLHAAELLEEIQVLYMDVFNRSMPKFIKDQLFYEFWNSEMPNSLRSFYTYALQETATAPRPSWQYTKAIVTRLKLEQNGEIPRW